MSTLHQVHLHDTPATPWRNGGGVAYDLVTWPGDDWRVRVSVAVIDRSGPFSSYAGISRWFTVLDGAGVTLHLPRGSVSLVPGDTPLQFDGADAPGCDLLDGSTHDLNFMAPQQAGRASMRQAAAGSRVEGPTRWRGLYTAGVAQLAVDGQPQTLPAGTLAWTDETGAVHWTLLGGGPAWWLTLEA